MSRLIDANAITESKELGKKIVVRDMTPYLNVEVLMDFIDSLPTIEAVPLVHGEWILHHIGAGHMWECSVCHKRPDIYITNNTNFCPNCGAKMKE